MAAIVFQCPQCSQLNTTRRLTCKNCGANFEVALAGIEPIEETTGSALALFFKVFIAIVILGILAAVALPKFADIDEPLPLSAARGIGSAINATIQAKHSDFLINAVPYTLEDCLADTSFTGGITYNTTPNNTPALGDICSNVAGNKICVNRKGEQFDWNWTAQVVDNPALIVEDSTSAFP